MAAKDKVIFVIGKKRAEDIMLREFFDKFDDDKQNKIAKNIICTVLKHTGLNWDPIVDGYPFLKSKADNEKISFIEEPKSTAKRAIVTKTMEEIPKHSPPLTIHSPICKEVADDNEDDLIPVPTGITDSKSRRSRESLD